MKNTVAIRHVAFEDLGSLENVLRDYEYAINYIEAAPGSLDGLDPLKPDLVVILGGPIGVYDEQNYPFLKDELRLLERRLTADLPTIGICLGAQLMARSLGAKVYPGHVKEIEWSSIKLSEVGWQSPLRYLASEYTPVLHWHGDTFELPWGATRLASNSEYENQAFKWGNNGLALQFHPEVTVGGLERWFIGHTFEISTTAGVSVTGLRQDTARYGQTLEKQAHQLWRAWLESVSTGASKVA